MTNNGGCEDICINTFNGYYCACSEGTVLEPGPSITCDSKCHDILGYSLPITKTLAYFKYKYKNEFCNTSIIDAFIIKRFFGSTNHAYLKQVYFHLSAGTLYCEDVYFYGRLCYCNVIGVPTPLNGTTCTNFDECTVNNGGCEQTCTDNDGSFTCSCDAGYILSDNGLSCSGKSLLLFLLITTSFQSLSDLKENVKMNVF